MSEPFDLKRYQDPLTIQRVILNAKTVAIVGLTKLCLALEIGDANVLASRLARGPQLGECRREWLDTQPRPSHRLFEEQGVAERFAVIGADVEENAAASAAEEILQKETVLADLRIEFHRDYPEKTATLGNGGRHCASLAAKARRGQATSRIRARREKTIRRVRRG